MKTLLLAALAVLSIGSAAHANDGDTPKTAHWGNVGGWSVDGYPDLRTCHASTVYGNGTRLTIAALPDRFSLFIYNEAWETLFYKGNSYALTFEIDGVWENMAIQAYVNGGVVVDDMGETFVKAFMAGDVFRVGMNGRAMSNMGLDASRKAVWMATECTLALNGFDGSSTVHQPGT